MDSNDSLEHHNILKTSRRNQKSSSRATDGGSPCFLPPIYNAETSSSGHHSPVYKTQKQKPKSRFHSDCTKKHSIYLDWTSLKIEKSPARVFKCNKTRSMTSLDSDEQRVVEFLDKNRQFLEDYITEKISLDTIEEWIAKKQSRAASSTTSSSMEQEIYLSNHHGNNRQTFLALLKTLKDDPTEHTVLWELASYISSSVGVDAYRVYKLYPDHPSFVQYFVFDCKSPGSEGPRNLSRAKPENVKFVLDVADTGLCQRFSRNHQQSFPEAPPKLRKVSKKTARHANHVMYQPILAKNGKTAYVIEMWRIEESFKEVDEEISSNFLVLGSIALHYCNMYLDKKRERSLSDFLLDVVKAIFEEMVSLDQLIKRILEFAQRLVNADRASLFLVDYRNFELVSTVFDLKFEPGQDRDLEKKEIRMPINRGIAGHVALSGETMNIPDAYSDYRFNREVDETTGYKTISILCMPIKVEGSVIGVVQMVNKRNENNFGHEDEVAFEIFSTFFGLALHHARLYDRIMRKEQKYRVALEVLSYHNTCREAEVITMLKDHTSISVDLADFYLDPFKFDEFQKCKCVIEMFSDLFDLTNFDLTTLTRFVLTVKKNYRTVPYHNFDHGWTVAHSMYVILKNDYQSRFDYKMRLALFVSCLCHDLDHRGYTNKYMSEIASPLAAMYTTSTLEHHHFNITVTILQQDGHNIFSHISSEDYKEILSFIRHCILATDLAKYFPNLEKMKQLHANDPPCFDWTLNSHRDLALAISMTAADLSASAKPWDIQIKTVKVIFEEFYDQGDKERNAGRVPIPMMDRNKPDEQPSSQVGFLSQICIPCYSILYRILPNTKPLYAMALKNLDRWKSRADRIRDKINRTNNAPVQEYDQVKAEQANEILEEDTEGASVIKTVENIDTNCSSVVIQSTPIIKEFEGEKVEALKGDAAEITGLTELQTNPVNWEDDEIEIKEFATRSGIWKNIDGVTWIDEEGVIINKKALKSIIEKERERNVESKA